MCITNKMHNIFAIRLYFPLDALHVSDCISPKHVERILKVKSNHKNFVHLVGYIHITCFSFLLSHHHTAVKKIHRNLCDSIKIS